MSKTALICGVSGQDGSYLAELLVGKKYEVIGTSRDAQISSFINLKKLGIREHVSVESMALNDFRSVLQTLAKVEPDEIYNFAGQSSVALSFEQPVETMESICIGTLNLLEAIRFLGKPTKLYNAGSGECFGNVTEGMANENTPYRPRSPYAVAKASAHWEIINYRESYGLFACTGILFNHESPLRPDRFVTKKVVGAAYRIANGSKEKLKLGNLDIKRDWGWAPEYVEAMWLMLRLDDPEDFVIATGKLHSLREFVQSVFSNFDLDWQSHVITDPALYRPSELLGGCGDSRKASEKLGWTTRTYMEEVANKMVASHAQDSNSNLV